MKDEDSLLQVVVTPSSTSTTSSSNKKDTTTTTDHHHNHNHNHHHSNHHHHHSAAALFSKGRYKLWALAAILLLAFWSMFTGTVTLRWSAGNLSRISDEFDTPLRYDLDVLEIEEREKIVKYMWDVYTNNRRIRLPKFWQQAFEAAYEDMSSDVAEVRENAISEIAKMSIRSVDLDPPPAQLTGTQELSLKHAEIRKTAAGRR